VTSGRRDGDRWGRWLRDLVLATRWHRRLLGAGLLAGSMAFALQALAPAAPPTVPVVSAARDLAAGERLSGDDLAVVRVQPGVVPDGAVRRAGLARGATLVSAVRRGELLTDARTLGRGVLDRLGPGLVAVPVRIADAAAVSLLRPGDLVDVLAAGAAEETSTGQALLVAAAVRVVTVPRTPADRFSTSSGEGSLVVLSTTSPTAARLAGAAVTARLSVVLRGR